jgi:hypothetical protein
VIVPVLKGAVTANPQNANFNDLTPERPSPFLKFDFQAELHYFSGVRKHPDWSGC